MLIDQRVRQRMFIPDHLTSFTCCSDERFFVTEAGTPTKSQRIPETTGIHVARCTKWPFLVLVIFVWVNTKWIIQPTKLYTHIGMFKHPILGYFMFVHTKVIFSFQKPCQLYWNHHPNVWKIGYTATGVSCSELKDIEMAIHWGLYLSIHSWSIPDELLPTGQARPDLLHTLTATAAQWPLFSSCALFLTSWSMPIQLIQTSMEKLMVQWYMINVHQPSSAFQAINWIWLSKWRSNSQAGACSYWRTWCSTNQMSYSLIEYL